ncbi:hypothetical protein H4R33_002843 [Dimargaris cristalligena]|uniref:Mis6-domain-containing protein n=1 Tax=Dimargaris cristalligena TaxID=215637 RepID=A0A4P9ZUG9_9FUNG|nr:hypothetical protein H4R33_002843 [Dimargaris cristalligena]RKP37187.1 Mis6-domain-containing protein [Dimargaris cristalligena]|eukprot:RKP37187.1 Mis6-domain-containing protein [Dimargaris cristalligena]
MLSTASLASQAPAELGPGLSVQLTQMLEALPTYSATGNTKMATIQLEKFAALVQHTGLSKDQLLTVLGFITHPNTAASTARFLIDQLYPRNSVPIEAVLRTLGFISRTQCYPIHARLLRWVVLVKDFVDDPAALAQLYGVFFHYLTYETLRPYAARLLVALTTQRVAKPFRVRKLLTLVGQVGNDPHLLLLLSLYRIYAPSDIIIPTDLPTPPPEKMRFKLVDRRWQETAFQIQQRWHNEAANEDTDSHPMRALLPRGGGPPPMVATFKDHWRANQRALLPPMSHQYPAAGTNSSETTLPYHHQSTMAALAGLTTFAEFARLVDRVQLPDRAVAALDHPFLSHLLACTTDPRLLARLSYWLEQYLHETVFWPAPHPTPHVYRRPTQSGLELDVMLQRLLRVAHITQELLPVVERFLIRYLRTWDGQAHRSMLFALLPFIRLTAFESLYIWLLKPLHRLFKMADRDWQCQLLQTYTQLLKRWLIRANLDATAPASESESESGSESSGSESGSRPTTNFRRMTIPANTLSDGSAESDTTADLDTHLTLVEFVAYVNKLCLLTLLANPRHPTVHTTILAFYRLLAAAPQQFRAVGLLSLPSYPIVHLLFFSGQAATVSALLGIIAEYRVVLDLVAQSAPPPRHRTSQSRGSQPPASPYDAFGLGVDEINRFNFLLLDTCHALWTSSAFKPPATPRPLFNVSPGFLEYLRSGLPMGPRTLKSSFTIFNNLAFGSFQRAFIQRSVAPQSSSSSPTPEAASSSSPSRMALFPSTPPPISIMGTIVPTHINQESFGQLKPRLLDPQLRHLSEFRLAYLAYLKQLGFGGLSRFVHIAMSPQTKRPHSN